MRLADTHTSLACLQSHLSLLNYLILHGCRFIVITTDQIYMFGHFTHDLIVIELPNLCVSKVFRVEKPIYWDNKVTVFILMNSSDI